MPQRQKLPSTCRVSRDRYYPEPFMAKDLVVSTWKQVDEIPRQEPRDSFCRESRQKLPSLSLYHLVEILGDVDCLVRRGL